MTRVFSQEEIDALLSLLSGEGKNNPFESIERFEEYLTKREFTPEKPYGSFSNDVSICRFFSAKNESLLEDIKRKNEEQGYGNIKIPNTDITLINYSFCKKCKTVFSFKDIIDYYKNPKPDQNYENRAHQYRNDTRVFCNNCSTYFIPSLVITDGRPRNEVQLLCRAQTVEEVEKYLYMKNIMVLTKNKSNIVESNGLRAIKNDVFIKDLEERSALITNIIQYTPYNLIMNFIDGTNVEKGDLIFDEWKIVARGYT